MSPIFAALKAGKSAKQILDYFGKLDPQLATKIMLAQQAGHSAEKILNYVSKGGKSLSKHLPDSGSKGKNLYEQSMFGLHKDLPNMGKAALAVGALAGAGLAASGAMSAGRAGAAITPEVLPAIGETAPSSLLPAPTIEVPGVKKPAGTSPAQLTQQPSAGQTPPPPVAPSAPSAPPPNQEAGNLLDSLGLRARVDNLAANNPPDVITHAVHSIMTPAQRKEIKKQGIDLNKIIADYISAKPAQTPQQPQPNAPVAEQNAPVNPPVAQAPQSQEPVKQQPVAEQPQPESDKRLAAMPSGEMGTIESIKNGVVKVNDNGKIRSFKASDIQMEPEELVNFVNEVAKIPAEERSSNIQFYLRSGNDMIVKFRGGEPYTYKDVPEEDWKFIVERKGLPKTTGKTTTGESWTAGIPGVAGASIIQKLISNPRYSKENEGKTWTKGMMGYDIFKPLDIRPKKVKEPSKKQVKKQKSAPRIG